MSSNDTIALNTEYEAWESTRAKGLAILDPDASPFEFFCAEQFLKPYVLLTDPDILHGLVGKSDDGGVDSFYFIVNGQLVTEDFAVPSQAGQQAHIVLIQSKENKGFAPTQVDRFDTFTDDLFDLGRTPDKYGRVYHEKLQDLMSTFKEKYRLLSMPQTTVDYYYITRADVAVNRGCKLSAGKVLATAKRHFSRAKINPFHFINGPSLYSQIQSRPPITKDLQFVEWVESPEGWIGLVKLSEFARFLLRNGRERDDRMFDDNVRGFYRDTAVNRSIFKTLSHPARMPEFWLLNNGVTVLSSRVQPKSYKILEVTDPQVVNGLQTSRQILAYFDTNTPPKEDKRRLLVKVIQNSDEDTRDLVIRATNNQNPMPAESLFTTFRIHKQIESVFKKHGLYYERRKGFYRDQHKPIAEIVSALELIQAVIAIMTDRQDDARGRPKGYIVDEEKRWKLFGHDDYDESVTEIDEKVAAHPPFDIKVYLNCVRLIRRIDQYLQSMTRLSVEDRRNIRFYLAKSTACIAIGNAYCAPAAIAKLDIESIGVATIASRLKQVKKLYQRLGGDDDAGRSPNLSAALNKALIRELSPPRKP
jgi:hypothetical protein